jgi:dihydrofolate synthase/folylpolyglutamate synthase
VDEWWATATGTERGADPSVVAEELSQLGAECVRVSPDLAAALQHLKASVVGGDRVIVLGSFHTVGPALRYLGLY